MNKSVLKEIRKSCHLFATHPHPIKRNGMSTKVHFQNSSNRSLGNIAIIVVKPN